MLDRAKASRYLKSTISYVWLCAAFWNIFGLFPVSPTHGIVSKLHLLAAHSNFIIQPILWLFITLWVFDGVRVWKLRRA